MVSAIVTGSNGSAFDVNTLAFFWGLDNTTDDDTDGVGDDAGITDDGVVTGDAPAAAAADAIDK